MKTESLKPVPVVGIDFGTTTSTACLKTEGGYVFIKPEGDAQDSLMPSVVRFTGAADEDHVVGLPAIKNLSPEETRNVVQHIKREMAWDAEWDKNLTAEERLTYTFHSRSYRPAEIAGRIIRHLKRAAENHLAADFKLRSQFDFDGEINTAVITVPAQFGLKERASIVLAAKTYGGFREVHLLEEPVAAALGLKLHQQPGRRIVMIVDLGGGTLDVTLLCVGKNAPNGGFLELGRIGDNELGGTDWDNIIARHVVSTFCSEPGIRDRLIAEVRRQHAEDDETPPPANSIAFEARIDRLMRERADISRNFPLHGACESAKITLGDSNSKIDNSVVRVDCRDSVLGFIKVNVSRDWFNGESQPLSNWCAKRCEQLLGFISEKQLRKVGLKTLTWKQVDQIVLVGGGSRLPAVQNAIAKQSGKKLDAKSEELILAKSPQHLVAMGAAAYAEMRQNKTVLEGIGIPRSPRTFGVIHKVPKSEAQNGHGAAKKGLWPFVESWFRGRVNHDDEDLCEAFSPIIQISQAADEAVTKTYSLVNQRGKLFHAKIIEERFTRHHPDGKLYHLWDLHIKKPAPPDSQSAKPSSPKPDFLNEVTITMRYGNDHKLNVEATWCGETANCDLTEKDIQDRRMPYELNLKQPQHSG